MSLTLNKFVLLQKNINLTELSAYLTAEYNNMEHYVTFLKRIIFFDEIPAAKILDNRIFFVKNRLETNESIYIFGLSI